MIYLHLPNNLSYTNLLDSICNRIKRTARKERIIANRDYLLSLEERYINAARENELYSLSQFRPSMIFTLQDGDVRYLYEQYLVRERINNVYDEIINLAKDPKIKCPFCGGIGEPSNIDHFLPKSEYDHFSILPYNLIPICRDCNIGYKKEFFPKKKNEQLIHSYLDDNCIFNDRWLFAKFDSDFDSVNFYVKAPQKWSEDKQNKVKFHFKTFRLANRYACLASTPLSEIKEQIKICKSMNLSISDAEECLINPRIKKEKVNYWENALYYAIKDNFLSIWNSCI